MFYIFSGAGPMSPTAAAAELRCNQGSPQALEGILPISTTKQHCDCCGERSSQRGNGMNNKNLSEIYGSADE